jgi:hypothetical protein
MRLDETDVKTGFCRRIRPLQGLGPMSTPCPLTLRLSKFKYVDILVRNIRRSFILRSYS